MRTSKSALASWSDLSRDGPLRPLVPGDRVGRGFADLGFEEFLILDEKRIVSLMTGTVTERRSDETAHLFLIPSVDEAFDIVVRGGVDIEQLLCEDGRTWKALAKVESTGIRTAVQGETVEDVAIGLCRLVRAGRI